MPRIRRGEDAIDQDFALHCGIADATGNPQFRRFMEHLGRFIIPRQTIRGGPGMPKRAYQRDVPEGAPRHRAGDPQRRGVAGARRHAPPSAQQPQPLPEACGQARQSLTLRSVQRLAGRKHHAKSTGHGRIGRHRHAGCASCSRASTRYPLERPRSTRRPGAGRDLRQGGSGGHGRGRARRRGSAGHRPSRRLLGRRAVGDDPQRQYHRLLQSFRGRAPAPGSSGSCSRRRIMRSASIRGSAGSASRRRCGPTPATASARRSARRSPPSMPSSTACASPACASVTSPTRRWTSAGCRSGSSRRIWSNSSASGSSIPDIRYEIFYGASDNARGWWDNSAAFRFGYRPQGRAEDHSAEALAADAQAAARSGRRMVSGRTILQRRVRRRHRADADVR